MGFRPLGRFARDVKRSGHGGEDGVLLNLEPRGCLPMGGRGFGLLIGGSGLLRSRLFLRRPAFSRAFSLLSRLPCHVGGSRQLGSQVHPRSLGFVRGWARVFGHILTPTCKAASKRYFGREVGFSSSSPFSLRSGLRLNPHARGRASKAPGPVPALPDDVAGRAKQRLASRSAMELDFSAIFFLRRLTDGAG